MVAINGVPKQGLNVEQRDIKGGPDLAVLGGAGKGSGAQLTCNLLPPDSKCGPYKKNDVAFPNRDAPRQRSSQDVFGTLGTIIASSFPDMSRASVHTATWSGKLTA